MQIHAHPRPQTPAAATPGSTAFQSAPSEGSFAQLLNRATPQQPPAAQQPKEPTPQAAPKDKAQTHAPREPGKAAKPPERKPETQTGAKAPAHEASATDKHAATTASEANAAKAPRSARTPAADDKQAQTAADAAAPESAAVGASAQAADDAASAAPALPASQDEAPLTPALADTSLAAWLAAFAPAPVPAATAAGNALPSDAALQGAKPLPGEAKPGRAGARAAPLAFASAAEAAALPAAAAATDGALAPALPAAAAGVQQPQTQRNAAEALRADREPSAPAGTAALLPAVELAAAARLQGQGEATRSVERSAGGSGEPLGLPAPAMAHGMTPGAAHGARASEAAAPFMLQLPAALGSAEFAPSLALSLTRLARDGVQEARLQIHPAEMGPIDVRISVEGTQARVDFTADMAATRSAIEAGLSDLASALRESGLTLTGGGVFQQQNGKQAEPAEPGVARPGDAGEGELAALAPALPRRAAAGVVDLYA